MSFGNLAQKISGVARHMIFWSPKPRAKSPPILGLIHMLHTQQIRATFSYLLDAHMSFSTPVKEFNYL